MAEEKKYHYVIVKCKDQKMFDEIKVNALIPMMYTNDNGKLAGATQWQVVGKIKKDLSLKVQPFNSAN